jgi:predicted acylesterase/phospholipase RssA
MCDLVMKGGIASGVIYPLAACELAREYSFKNIGGTSAGAVAAAVTAAAEYGRRQGRPGAKAFDGLAALPAWIGRRGRLLELFRPDPGTRTLFRLLMAGINARTPLGRILAISAQRLAQFWKTAFVLAAAVGGVSTLLLGNLTGFLYAYTMAATILFGLAAFLLVVAAFLYRQFTSTLPANFYGLARACDPATGPADAPLTNWLTGYLNELAGKPLAEGPLTFGDLYAARPVPGDPEPKDDDYRAINLEVMTTALNLGRPFRLPFRDPDRVFYFAKEEFARLFPAPVVDHMVAHARTGDAVSPVATGVERLYGFPDARDLPVVVATRMSLSFPVMFSAVPLYAVDFTLRENQKTKAPRAERCWFSDGGICSNLPIHFFDSALPRWPTFAINLKQFHPDHPTEADAVWLPTNAGSGWLPVWARFEEPGAFGDVSRFLGAVVATMQNWQDNMQARVPGYRDRLVHVSQRDD